MFVLCPSVSVSLAQYVVAVNGSSILKNKSTCRLDIHLHSTYSDVVVEFVGELELCFLLSVEEFDHLQADTITGVYSESTHLRSILLELLAF